MSRVLASRMQVDAYSASDPMTRLGGVARFLEPKFLDDLQGGAGSFKLLNLDNQLSNHPSWFVYENLIRCSIDGKVVGAFVIKTKNPKMIDQGEYSGETTEFSGPGPRTWLGNAVVEPSHGLTSGATTNRAFNFAAERGDWFDNTAWISPTPLQQYSATATASTWSIFPKDWPITAAAAYWVWGVTNSDINPAPEGINYFRYEFEVTDGDGEGDYTIYATGNDAMQVFVDGGQVSQSDGVDPYQNTYKVGFHLSIGKHVIAARVYNAEGKAAFISALYRNADDPALNPTLKGYTGDNVSWLVNPYPEQVPGWSVGEIITQLWAEAEGRGVWFPRWLIPTFNSFVDSNGNAWPEALDWIFDIGLQYDEVLKKLEEVGFESWIDPETLAFNLVPSRGSHKDQVGTSNCIALERGKDLTDAGQTGVSGIKNNLLINSTDGWFEQASNDASSLEKYGRVEGYISTQASLAVSVLSAAFALDQRSTPSVSSSYSIIPTKQNKPFEKIIVGDWLVAPDDTNTLVPRRIVSLAAGVDGDTGRAIYETEFDTIYKDREDRNAEWLAQIDHGSLGGTFKNSSSGTLRLADPFGDFGQRVYDGSDLKPLLILGPFGTQAIPAGAYTQMVAALTGATIPVNRGMRDVSAGQVTIEKPGLYEVILDIGVANQTTFVGQVLLNSIAPSTSAMIVGAYITGAFLSATSLVYLNAGDILRVFVYMSTAGAVNTYPGQLVVRFIE